MKIGFGDKITHKEKIDRNSIRKVKPEKIKDNDYTYGITDTVRYITAGGYEVTNTIENMCYICYCYDKYNVLQNNWNYCPYCGHKVF